MGKVKRNLLLALGLVLTCCAGLASTAGASHAFPKHRCGSFIAEHTFSDGDVVRDRVTVFNSNHLSCRSAIAVIEGFWGPEDQIVRHGGPSEAESYYTIKGFPGWRCYQGAGGGSCLRKGKVAGYSAKNA